MILATYCKTFFDRKGKAKIYLLFAFVLLSFQSTAQFFDSRFKLSSGYSSYLLETGTKISPVHSLGITPQLSLWQPKSNFSIAFVSPMTVGIHFRTKVLFRMFVFSDIPLMGEINYGHLATKDFRKWWGAFVGGGYTFQSAGTRWQQGASLSGGFRFFLFRQSWTLRYARFFSRAYSGDYASHRLTLELNFGKFLKNVNFKNKLSKFEKPFQ